MTSRLWPRAAVGALCAAIVISAGTARADVTTENSISVEGVGAMAFGNMTGTTRTTISGDKSRSDTDIQMKSRLVRMLAHSAVGPTADIVRLDQDKLYHLNINKKEYTETTFEQFREQMKKVTDQMSQGGQADQKPQAPSAIDQSKCELLPATSDVTRTGEKAQFAGYDAQRVTITASQPCKDKQTGAICEITLVVDEWLASGFTQNAEVLRYQKAYAQKMGLDAATLQDASQRAKALFSQYKGIWGEIATKLQGMKGGYPVKSSFTLALGGQQCQSSKDTQTADGQPGAGTGNDASATGTMGNIAGQMAAAKLGGGGVGGAAVGNLAGQMAGKLGSFFHKKKDDSDAAAAPDQPAAPASTPVAVPPGDVALMTITSQLVSVSNASAPTDAFEIPAGFKKEETKTQQ
jgi:hypothetical protein